MLFTPRVAVINRTHLGRSTCFNHKRVTEEHYINRFPLLDYKIQNAHYRNRKAALIYSMLVINITHGSAMSPGNINTVSGSNYTKHYPKQKRSDSPWRFYFVRRALGTSGSAIAPSAWRISVHQRREQSPGGWEDDLRSHTVAPRRIHGIKNGNCNFSSYPLVEKQKLRGLLFLLTKQGN